MASVKECCVGISRLAQILRKGIRIHQIARQSGELVPQVAFPAAETDLQQVRPKQSAAQYSDRNHELLQFELHVLPKRKSQEGKRVHGNALISEDNR